MRGAGEGGLGSTNYERTRGGRKGGSQEIGITGLVGVSVERVKVVAF